MSHKARETLFTGIFFYALIALLLYKTVNLPSSAAVFPRACLVLLLLLNTIMIAQDFIKYPKSSQEKGVLTWKTVRTPLLAFVGIFVYVFLFDKIGYFPASIIMMIGFMLALKVKPWWKILLITAAYAVFIYLLFVLWLHVRIL